MVQIIRAERNLFVPEKPPVPVPRRSSNIILGKITSKAKELDKRSVDKEGHFDRSARQMWRDNEAKGIGSIHEKMQQQVPLVVDDSLVGTRIEYLSEFDIEDPDQGSTKILEWCGGVVERICDRT